MKASATEIQGKKLILIFPFDLLSHYLRCIALANAHFSKDEYEIMFLESSRYSRFVKQHHFKTFSCAQFDAEAVMHDARRFDFSWLNDRDIAAVLTSQVNMIRSLGAGIVVGDASPTLRMAAELTGVKYISVVNGYMTPYYAFPRKLSIRHQAYPFLKILPAPWFAALTRFGEKLSLKNVHKPFARLRKRYGLQKVSNYLAELEGDVNLICDIPELFPQKELPENYLFVGPLTYKHPEVYTEVDMDEGSAPVIFITMGSSGNWRKLGFLNGARYAHFKVITAGDSDKVLNAPHISSYDFVDIGQVLSKAALMICHGGNGTIYYGLQKGVYMLCLTSHFEQEWNVHALERIGYGKSADRFTKDDWKREINNALNIRLEPYFRKRS